MPRADLKAEIDPEGNLWPADKQAPTRYEIVSRLAVGAERVPDSARAAHPDYERYVLNTGVRPDTVGALHNNPDNPNNNNHHNAVPNGAIPEGPAGN